MNKTYLIAGGASVASLAIGGAAGYFIARRRFNTELDIRIEDELKKTVKHYSVLLMEARSGKPDSPADIQQTEQEEDLTPEDEEVIVQGRQTLANAAKALTDYKGISTKNRDIVGADKPALETVVKHNIFTDAASQSKKTLPPKDPETGRFIKRPKDEPAESKHDGDDPYIITHEEFLLNEPEHEQENLYYFHNDKTLIQVYDNEPVDIDRVGEVNLTLFPEVLEGEESIVCVRNPWLQFDYEIKLMDESVTEYMGLGTEDGDNDPADEEDEDNDNEDDDGANSGRWA